MNDLKKHFLLDPNIHFLNHGSFGACPKPVIDVYQNWQKRLERQPVLFLDREINEHYQQARQILAQELKIDHQNLVYIPNATHGVNAVARSLNLQLNDEILASDHEYGACDFTWQHICKKHQAHYIQQHISLPVIDEDTIVDELWQGVSPRTKLIFISHITSVTALCMPVEKICRRAKQEGILTLIDGAHAPGQIALDLEKIGADFYTGNCHKWMMSPKGSAFLYAHPDAQKLLEPLVVSWGYGNDPGKDLGSRLLNYFQWSGTHEPSAALSVPAAIQFAKEHHWENVRQDCCSLLKDTLRRIQLITGFDALYPDDPDYIYQLAAARLPDEINSEQFKADLYDQFMVEVPLTEWDGKNYVRISVQGYNNQNDMDQLVQGIDTLLKRQV